MTRPTREFHQVKRMLEAGGSQRGTAIATGIPRSTIRNWHRRLLPPGVAASLRSLDVAPLIGTYSYSLGLYLGDGHITQYSKVSGTIRIVLDARYMAVVREAACSLARLMPHVAVRVRAAHSGDALIVHATSPSVPELFPQHGRGRKHLRRIQLAGWQRGITQRAPQHLLRGLIHSDGCRTINRFSTKLPSGRIAEYEYPRYFFTNLSADIRRIFCEHCELLGLRWTQSNARNISISHRDSVALLDSFVGAKT